MAENKRALGNAYEKKAAEYLHEKGYEILFMNYACKVGEIDIIARDGLTLVFVEVKYRRTSRYGLPEEAVDYRKQHKIKMVASYFMTVKHVDFDTPVRFDVIAILDNNIKHIKDGF